MADVASIALVQERAATDQQAVDDQLQLALSSRVVFEQAKGVLSHTVDVDMPTAFAMLRRYARDHNLRLSHLSHAVVHRATPVKAIVEHSARRAVRG